MVPSRELRYLIIVIIVSLLLAGITLLVHTRLSFHSAGGDAVIYSYKVFLADGGLLVERYDYMVVSEYHMLYRRWYSPLYVEGMGSGDYIGVIGVTCPRWFIGYVYSHDKVLYTISRVGEELRKDILERLVEADTRDEAGCYTPVSTMPGTYRVTYSFRLHAPLSCDATSCVLDLELASPGSHIYYERYEIKLSPVVESVALFPHSLRASIKRSGDGWVISGCCLYKEQGLRLVMIVPRDFIESPGSVKSVSRAENVFKSIVSSIEREEELAWFLGLGGALFALAAPVAAIAVYLTRGREAEPTNPVPEGFPPDTGEKPWQVNLLYNGDVGSFTWEVVPATLLDLAARNVISIERREEGLVIRLPRKGEEGELDSYERDLVGLLRLLSGDGETVVLAEGKGLGKKLRINPELRDRIRVLYGSVAYKGLARRAVKPCRRPFALAILLGIAAIIAQLVLYKHLWIGDKALAYKSVITWFLGVLAYVPPLLAPSYVFGRWSPEYLEKFLAWNRFREKARELGLGATSAQGLSGEWLRVAAYLVALGETELVEKELRKLGEEIAAVYASTLRTFHGLYYGYRGGARGFSGGGVSSGGFGGGGAGVR